jgi:3-hydroxyisobutyrate dehydrogenase-like beta-hydroxyacid dehydrogenase
VTTTGIAPTAPSRFIDELGFIGTGNMGSMMVRRLLAAGFHVTAHDRDSQRATAVVAEGARLARSVATAVPPGGVVLSMVTDDAALREIALSAGGVLESLGSGGIHVSTSTVSPELSAELASHYRERGCAYLAAPVLGRPDVAAAGRLSVLLAGDTEAKERVPPALRAFGARIHDFGPHPQAANAAKVAINFLILAGIEALAEAGGLADRAGVDRRELIRAARESGLFGGAVYDGYGTMIAEHRYTPALFRVALGLKDAMLASELAEKLGAELPIAAVAAAHLRTAEAAGWGDKDWAVIGRVLAGEPAPGTGDA